MAFSVSQNLNPMKNLANLLIFLLISNAAWAQQTIQTVKGTLTDAQSKYPLFGANVIVVGSSPFIGSSSDEKGHFKLTNVPIGRQTLKITYLGYGERTISNVLVTA